MSKNSELFEQAKAYYVGGVHAANRLHSCLGAPLYLDHVDGCHLYDADGISGFPYIRRCGPLWLSPSPADGGGAEGAGAGQPDEF